MPLLLTIAIRTVSGALSVFASVGLGLADGDEVAAGGVDVVAVLDEVGDTEGLALALLLGVTAGDDEVAVDVVVVVVAGVQEMVVKEILAAIAKLYNKKFFMNVITPYRPTNYFNSRNFNLCIRIYV